MCEDQLDNNLKRDINLIKKLEFKQKQLEEQMMNSRKVEVRRKFTSHPKRILSDPDTTLNTPKVLYSFSPSASNLDFKPTGFENRKQKAQDIHKRLHEKLSIISSNDSGRTNEFSEMGDNYMVPQKIFGDRFRNRPTNYYNESDSGDSSIDSEQDFEDSPCKNDSKKNLIKKRQDNNYSVASKATVGDRKSSGSKFSSQSFHTKGVPSFMFEKKCKATVEKCLHSITEIRSILKNGIAPPDGEEDESRRLVRNKEFSNRFSRNYLYPLARQIQELSVAQQPSPLQFNQKLLSTYQIVTNGLQAYQNHLPTSVGTCTFNQLRILMSHIVELCGSHRAHIKEEEESYLLEFIDTLKINAELTTQKVDEYLSNPSALINGTLKSENSKISLTKYGQGKKKACQKPSCKKVNADNRFSMYAVTASFRKDGPWKKVVENLAKKKFNVKSKYKTATYKHRPPVEKEPEILSIPRLKTLFPKKSGLLRTTRMNTPVNEDCIKTMVEIDQNGDTHLEKEEWENMEKKEGVIKNDNQSNKEEILMRLLQFALKNHKEGIKDDEQLHISEIFELVKKEPNMEFLNKVLDGLNIKKSDDNNKENQENQQLTLEIVKSQHSFLDGGGRDKSKRKEPKITISGDKNARLICITDENSIIEPPPQENEITDKLRQTEKVSEPDKIALKTSSETQTDIKIKENKAKTVTKGTQKGKNNCIKMSRVRKCMRNLKPLDKKQAVDAIQYKLDFYRFCKNNPMYKRSTTCQPWVLMGKISEELLNQCLLAVAREIEVNDIVERVYQSELQL